MTPLRREAFQLLESLPEENLFSVIQYLQAEKINRLSREQRLAEKKAALDEILQLRKSIPDLDEKKELDEYYREKFGYENLG